MLQRFSLPDRQSDTEENRTWNSSRNWEPDQYKAAESAHRSVTNLSQQIVRNEGFRRGQLLRKWFDILGVDIGSNACPSYIKNGTLFVNCSSPIWAQELTLQQLTILERFNQGLPADKQLNKIHCRVGKVNPPQSLTENSNSLPHAELSSEERQKVQALARQSRDEAIGQMIAKVYAQNLIHNQQLRSLGAKPCERCQRLSFTGSPCLECRRVERENLRLSVLRLLDKQPWLNYAALRERWPQLELGVFLNYHLALASSWRETIRLSINSLPKGTPLPEDLQVKMIKLVALSVSKPYDQLHEGEVKLALYKRYGEALLTRISPGPPEYDAQKRLK